jgi:hypothetical protein
MNVLFAHDSFSDLISNIPRSSTTLHEISLSELKNFSSNFVYDEIFIESGETLLEFLGSPVISDEIKSRIIGVGEDETDNYQNKKSLLRFINKNSLSDYFLYLIKKKEAKEDLSILIFDESVINIEMVTQLCRDFNHKLTVVKSFDDFFTRMSAYYDFIIFNIHAESCEISHLIKKVYSITNFKKAAVIPYLEQEHCNVSDLFSGLNKIARAVLNFEELIQFCIQYFYKRELKKIQNSLNSSFDSTLGEKIGFLQMPESEYANIGVDYVLCDPILDNVKINEITQTAERTIMLNNKIQPYLWWIKCSESISCGQGV